MAIVKHSLLEVSLGKHVLLSFKLFIFAELPQTRSIDVLLKEWKDPACGKYLQRCPCCERNVG